MGSTSPTPGVLYVSSCIRTPAPVTPEIYHKWYNEVHAPDLTNASGGPVVFRRYKNTNTKAHPGAEANSEVPWPYLALGKLSDIYWMNSPEFLEVSHDNDMLPAERGRNAWGCFDAGLRTYEFVNRHSPSASASTASAKYIVTVESASPAEAKEVGSKYSALPGFKASTVYRLVPGIMVHEEKGEIKKGYAVYEFDELPEDQGVGSAQTWELIHEVGDASEMF